ncbi:unnamed protein product, partial [Pylaiella littoralis]
LEIAPYSPLAVVMKILVRRTAVGVFVGVNQVLLLVLVSFLWHHRRAAHQTAYIKNKVGLPQELFRRPLQQQHDNPVSTDCLQGDLLVDTEDREGRFWCGETSAG